MVEATPRVATADWLRLLQRSLVAGGGFGFERYSNVSDLKRHGIDKGAQTGVVDLARLEAFKAVPPPCCLTLATDQERLQITAVCFAKDVLSLTVEVHHDWYHRVWNDLNGSIRSSGLFPAFLNSFMFLNIAHGPWQKCAWFHVMSEQACDLAQCLAPNDPELLKLWPRIVTDRRLDGEMSDALVGEAGRAEYCKNLHLSRCFLVNGEKAQMKDRDVHPWGNRCVNRNCSY